MQQCLNREPKIQPNIFLTEIFGSPLGSRTSAPSGHGCPLRHACFSRVFANSGSTPIPWSGPLREHGLNPPLGTANPMHEGFSVSGAPFLDLVLQINRPRGGGRPLFAEGFRGPRSFGPGCPRGWPPDVCGISVPKTFSLGCFFGNNASKKASQQCACWPLLC